MDQVYRISAISLRIAESVCLCVCACVCVLKVESSHYEPLNEKIVQINNNIKYILFSTMPNAFTELVF